MRTNLKPTFMNIIDATRRPNIYNRCERFKSENLNVIKHATFLRKLIETKTLEFQTVEVNQT